MIVKSEYSRVVKARKFVELGLVKRTVEGNFVVYPLPGNKRIHFVSAGVSACSCQGSKYYSGLCSHALACKLFIEITE